MASLSVADINHAFGLLQVGLSDRFWLEYGNKQELELTGYNSILSIASVHYKNMPIQIYGKFYHQKKMKIFR